MEITKLYKKDLKKIIKNTFKEDIPKKDITTINFVSKKEPGFGKIIAKESGILCGIGVAIECFKYIDKKLKVKINKIDGDKLKKNDVLAEISGNKRSICK